MSRSGCTSTSGSRDSSCSAVSRAPPAGRDAYQPRPKPGAARLSRPEVRIRSFGGVADRASPGRRIWKGAIRPPSWSPSVHGAARLVPRCSTSRRKAPRSGMHPPWAREHDTILLSISVRTRASRRCSTSRRPNEAPGQTPYPRKGRVRDLTARMSWAGWSGRFHLAGNLGGSAVVERVLLLLQARAVRARVRQF